MKSDYQPDSLNKNNDYLNSFRVTQQSSHASQIKPNISTKILHPQEAAFNLHNKDPLANFKNIPHMKRVSNLTDSNHEYMNSQSSPSYNQKMSGKFVSNQEFEQALGSGKDGPVVLKQMLIGQRDISNSFKIGRKLQIKEFQIIQEESKLNTVREKQVQYGQSKPTETSAPSSVKNKDEQKNKFRRSSPLNKSMSSSKRNIQSSTLQNSQNRGGSSPRGKTDSVSKLKSLVIAKSVKKKSDAEASAN